MKIKIIALSLSLLSFMNIMSQEKISSFAGNGKSAKELFTVLDHETKQPTVFFISDNSLTAARFDNKFQLVDDLTIQFKKKEVTNIFGTSGSKNKYFVYMGSYNGDGIVAQQFDFDTKTTKSHLIQYDKEIDKGKKKNIADFTANDIYYSVTSIKGTDLLHIYSFQNGSMNKNVIDLSSFKFLNKTHQKITFWDLYNENNSGAYAKSIESIPSDTPPSLVLATNKKKSYVKDGQVTFTFDVNQSFTQTLTINLSNFTATQKTYAVPFVPLDPGERPDLNSFLVNDVLIQMKVKSKLLELTAKSLDDTVLKSISLRSDEEVSFKNSEIIQENGSMESTRILGSSKQLIRKMHNLFPAVTGYYIDDKFYIILGGVSAPKEDQSVMVGGIIGGFTGALIAAAISSNSTAANLNSYEDKKIVYIQSVFDKDFNHVPGAYKKLAFDKLRLFIENSRELSNHSTFKLGRDLYLLAFDKKKNEYSFYKFQE